ncbi:restriction endonuclease subunit S [Luteimonas fraxinea]|uniref:Restriction endonuclease subunit S n=1 Tax=Luteimonas fraxinea TaxID=2901869 RepID=A0ABS8UAA9_9GAMM|nr:restriction endonuclease subunit S [Luteimonas fraxinea]MCD9096432.1 restriction endonuclease subunit S [Luteimonas fraxinea]
MLRVNNFQGHSLNLSEVMRIASEIEAKYGRTRIQTGDVLLTIVGSVGQVAVVPKELDGWNIARAIAMIRPNKPELSRWLSLVLRSPQAQYQLGVAANTTVQTTINLKDLRELRVPMPDDGEREAIAHILGMLDDKIELNRSRNQTLEAMTRALFKDWFVDFGPVRAKMEGRKPYLPNDIWQLFSDRIDDEGKPEGWEMQPLSELLTIIGGGTPKTSVDEYWGGEIPWFSVVDTPSASDVFVVATEKNITAQGLAGSSARLVPKGATIISARGTVGNLAIAGCEMTFNQSCYGLRGTGSAGDYFVYLTAQQMVDQLKSMAHGSVFSTITRQTFETIRRPFPPPAVLTAFERLMTGWFDAILSSVEESRSLAQLHDTLLPKLISGELRIADAKKFMERTRYQAASQTGKMS